MRWKVPNPWAKKDAAEHAAHIIERHAKKRAIQGMLTPAQEELRKELGIHPQGYKKDFMGKPIKEAKDPLTNRQRALLKELGLDKDQEE